MFAHGNVAGATPGGKSILRGTRVTYLAYNLYIGILNILHPNPQTCIVTEATPCHGHLALVTNYTSIV